MRTCTECGGELPPRCTVTCSKPCRTKRLRRSDAYKDANRRYRKSDQYRKDRVKHRKPRKCERCGEPCRSDARFCTKKCSAIGKSFPKRAQAAARVKLAARGTKGKRIFRYGACENCGEVGLFARRTQRTCGAECAKELEAVERSERRKGRHLIRRIEVFERDGYRCWICGEMTDKDAKVPALRAPTVDHVVAVALGGSNDPSNLRCAHLSCNSRRGVGGASLAA